MNTNIFTIEDYMQISSDLAKEIDQVVHNIPDDLSEKIDEVA